MEDINRTKTMEQDLILDLSKAITAQDTREQDKIASKFSDILALGGFFYGACRQIYGELNDGKFHKLTADDTDKIKIENDNERIKVSLPVSPDIEEFMGETSPRKLRGEPYLQTGSGRYVEGYFTTLKTPAIEKKVNLLDVYPYDFVEEMKKSRQMSIFKKEDIYWFKGNYGVIGSSEADFTRIGYSIKTTTSAAWDANPLVDSVELLKAHSAPAKRRQPRELLVMPESRYLDFAKVPQTAIDGLSRELMDNGFSPDNSPLFGSSIRKLMLNDYRGMTFSPHDPNETLFYFPRQATAFARELQSLKFFGYNIADESTGLDPADRDALATILKDRYDVDYDCESGSPDATYKTKSKFHRIMVYAPLNYLGRVYQWKRDVRNHFTVANDTVSTYSDETITYMFHNKNAITCLDIWF
jgi:hypothetical protein